MGISGEEFARVVTAFLRGKGEGRPIAFDAARRRLVVGAGEGPLAFVHLGHAREEWEASPVGERPRVLHRRLWSSLQAPALSGREAVLQAVLPRVRDLAWFSAMRRQAELELGADEEAIDEVLLPHTALNEELGVHLAFELPSSLSEVGAERLDAWGLTFDELLARAKQNLARSSTAAFEEVAPGVFASPFRDSLDATRMVLPELFTTLAVQGRPVALAPTHDTLFVTGDDDTSGLQRLAALAEEALSGPRAHTATAFRLLGGRWQPWLPDRAHPAFPRLKLLALQTLASAYSRQKEVLEALLEANGHDLQVATLRAFRAPGGDIFTSCVWQEGAEALLPQTDRIDFVRPGAGGAGEARAWSTTFGLACATLGELMQPIGDVPERWRVQGFPTEEQLEAMAAMGKLG